MESFEGSGKTVLLGEDDVEMRGYLSMALRCKGYEVATADDGEDVLRCVRSGRPISTVILDVLMPRKNGLDTLREIKEFDPTLPVIMLSGANSIVSVVEAMKRGASNFLSKPFNEEELDAAIAFAMQESAQPAAPAPETPAAARPRASHFRSLSPAVRNLEATVGRLSSSDIPVLIQGETGAGKEIFARMIHAQSKRSHKPFLKLNCAALPSELVESELFGYERGAFTGAYQRKPGMFELADEGTLMLDEIGDMDFKLQAKLLQVLQDREFNRLGGKETVRVNVRVLAATHKDLEAQIENNQFRPDLYYRLSVLSLRVPALRERPEDIVPLADFLLRKHATPGETRPVLPEELKQALTAYHWPGNIRELENVVRNFGVLGDAFSVISDLRAKGAKVAAHAAAASAAAGAGSSAPRAGAAVNTPVLEQVSRAKEQAESAAILAALDETRWNRKRAAALLNIDYKALLYKMKKLSIDENPPSGV